MTVGKKDNTQIILIGLIIILAVIAASVQTGTLKLGCLTCGGFTVNSITPVNALGQPTLISNDADISRTSFMLDVTVNGGGQPITGTIQPTEFKQLSGVETTVPLGITINNVKESLDFTIANQGTIWKYDVVREGRANYFAGASCTGTYWRCIPITRPGSGLGYDYVLKIYQNDGGHWGLINPPSISWTGEMTMTVGGVSTTKQIGSGSQPGQGSIEGTIQFGSYGSAKWYGSLITGAAMPNNNAFVAVQHLSDPWKVSTISYKTAYDTYSNNFELKLNDLIRADTDCINSRLMAGDPCESTRSAIYTHIIRQQDSYLKLIEQNTIISTASGISQSYEQTTSGDKITELAVTRYTNPKLQILLAASTVGVKIPVGKPEIVDPVSPITFASGDNNGLLTFKVRNVGTGTGSFRFTLTDPGNEFYTDPVESNGISVATGGEATVTLNVYHRTASEKSSTVTIKVYDYNAPNNYDTATVSITMSAPKACTPGVVEIQDDFKTVMKCNPDGMGKSIELQCQTGTVIKVGGEYKCSTTYEPVPTYNGDGTQNGMKVTYGRYVDWYNTPQAAILLILIAALIIVAWRKKNE